MKIVMIMSTIGAVYQLVSVGVVLVRQFGSTGDTVMPFAIKGMIGNV